MNYSVADFRVLLEENMETIDVTKQKFINYRETVKKRAKELEEENINVKKLSAEDEEKLNNLKIIEHYLSRGIDEHQKILNSHFDLKILYERELELLAQMSLIQRFSLRNELYDKVLEEVSVMDRMDVFLRPLFYQTPEKIYNPNKALELQRPVRRKAVEEETEVLDFSEEEWQEELIRKQKEKLGKYKKSISLMMDILYEKENVTLEEMKQIVEEKEGGIREWIPDINLFKEIMVEFIKAKEINLKALRKNEVNT